MSIVYTVTVLSALGLMGAMAKLHVNFEDLTFEAIDPEYFDPEKTDAFITDDNEIAGNVSIVNKLPPESNCHFELLGLSMGEYTQSTGFDMLMDCCILLQDPIIFGPAFTQMGMSPDVCPPEPGIYIHKGFAPPMENLPDNFYENRYLAIFEIMYEEKTLLSMNVYLNAHN